ncbi:MAG: META domain-containing protein [Chitinophagaceae bacterium]
MKTLFFIAAFYFLSPSPVPVKKQDANTTVDAQQVNKEKADTATLNGLWYLQPLLAADTAAGKIPFLQISLSASTFSGNTGCNNMRGGFTRTDTSFIFNKNIVTTKMLCTGYDEAAFIRSLQRTNGYKLENGELILLFNATELSRWTRKPAVQPKTNKA